MNSWKNTLNNHTQKLGLGFLLIMAAQLRFFRLKERGFWYDEIETWYATLSGRINSLDAPLNRLLNMFFTGLSGNASPYTFHLITVGFGLLTLVALWFIFQEEKYFNGQSLYQFTIIAIVTFSPFHIYYSQEARPYSLLILLSTISYWTFYRALNKNNWKNWTLFGFVISLLILTHLTSLALIAGFFAYFFYLLIKKDIDVQSPQRFKNLKKPLVALIVATLLGLCWFFLPEVGRHPPSSIPSGIYGLGFLHFFQNYFRILGGHPSYYPFEWTYFIPSFLIFLILCFGLYSFYRKKLFYLFIPFLTCLCFNLGVLFFTLGPVMSQWAWLRYASSSFIAFIFCFAEGLWFIKGRSKKLGIVICLAYVTFLNIGLRKHIRNYTYNRSAQYIKLTNKISNSGSDIKGIILAEHTGYRVLSHFYLYRKDPFPLYSFREAYGLKRIELAPSVVGQFQYPRVGETVNELSEGEYLLIFNKSTNCNKIKVGNSFPMENTGLIYRGNDLDGEVLAMGGCHLSKNQ